MNKLFMVSVYMVFAVLGFMFLTAAAQAGLNPAEQGLFDSFLIWVREKYASIGLFLYLLAHGRALIPAEWFEKVGWLGGLVDLLTANYLSTKNPSNSGGIIR